MSQADASALRVDGDDGQFLHATWSRSGKRMIVSVGPTWDQAQQVALTRQQADELASFAAEDLAELERAVRSGFHSSLHAVKKGVMEPERRFLMNMIDALDRLYDGKTRAIDVQALVEATAPAIGNQELAAIFSATVRRLDWRASSDLPAQAGFFVPRLASL